MKRNFFILVILFIAVHASAHHSASAFDRSSPLIVMGTVEEFRWTNPHSWVTVQVPNDEGGYDKWVLEGGSTPIMVRNGWTADSLKPGQWVKCLIAPNRDGSTGGELLSVTFKDGSVLAFGVI